MDLLTRSISTAGLIIWWFIIIAHWSSSSSNAYRTTRSPPPLPQKMMELIEHTDPNYAHQWSLGTPVIVKTGFYIESLSSINPKEMAFDVDLYLRQSWYDQRLRHNENRHFTIRDGNISQYIWIPDLYFANAKVSEYQWVTKPNIVMFIYPDGHVHLSSRVISTVACNLNLRKYPLDTQECEIRILSYAYTEKELKIEWFDSPDVISFNKEIQLPEMTLQGTRPEFCNDTFSCLTAKLYFRREIGYHMVQTYIPTFLIVVISWISFWIDPAAIPARISLSFTTLLTLATMTAGIRTALPPVSYAKAIDYWIGICILFVFGALLEFAFVSSFVRRAAKLQIKISGTIPKYPAPEDAGCIDDLPPIIVASGDNVDDLAQHQQERIPFVDGSGDAAVPINLFTRNKNPATNGGGTLLKKRNALWNEPAPPSTSPTNTSPMLIKSSKMMNYTNNNNNSGSTDGTKQQLGRPQQLLSPTSPYPIRRRGSRRLSTISVSRASGELDMTNIMDMTPTSPREIEEMENLRKRFSKIAAIGDTISRVAFPMMFLFFNMIYWSVFI